MNEDKIRYNRGYNDGKANSRFAIPAHRNWNRDRNGKITHYDKNYLAGYIDGWKSESGVLPWCFPNR